MASTGSQSSDTTNPSDALPDVGTGWRRFVAMWKLFRNERDDPEPFYRVLAAEAVADLDDRYGVDGRTILDLGCGPGWYVDAFRRAGATTVGLDGDEITLRDREQVPGGLMLGDAANVPVADGTFDGVFCSNLLEHAADTAGVIDEIARVLKPGGWAFMSWTNWYSPHGGHQMSPYHLLGPRLGVGLYERLHGPPDKNVLGEGLFVVHIGPTVRMVESHPDLEIERVEPRYWPQLRAICKVPGLREVATWNCVIRVRKRGGDRS